MEIKNANYGHGNIRAIGKDVEETRTITFVFSAGSKDRHKSVLNQDNWDLKNFNNNGIVGYQHNVYGAGMCDPPNPDDVIGRAVARVEENDGVRMLVGDITFEPKEINEQAEKIFRKILFGSLKAVSVGFLPIPDAEGKEGKQGRLQGNEVVDKDTFFFNGQELIEISVVNIPSNPDALKKALRGSTSNAIMFIKRTLGNDYSFSDIEDMKVRDVLSLVDGSEIKKDESTDTDDESIDVLPQELQDSINRQCNELEKELIKEHKEKKEPEYDSAEYEYRQRQLNLRLK